MMNTRKLASAVLCALMATVLAGCALGLSPSWKDKSGTKVSLSLSTLGSLPAGQVSRAVMPGVNYLYIRTVGIAGKSTGSLFGPFTVEAGSKFVTTEIPPGEYERISVLASGKDLETDAPRFDVFGGSYTLRELLSLPDAQFIEFVEDDTDKSSFDEWFEGMVCFGELMGVTIQEGTENALSLTLTPNIPEGDRIDLFGAPLQVYSSSVRSRHFYRLDGINVSLPVTTETLSCTLTAKEGTGTAVYDIAFYTRDGVLISGTKTGTDLASGITLTIASSDVAALAGSTGYIELYQYLDFTGTVVANYQGGASTGDITVKFDGQGNSALYGRRLLLAVYDASVLPAAITAQTWETIPAIAYTIMDLDSVSGSGSVTIPVSGTSGAGYCVSAQIDMGGHYAGLSSFASVDIATIVPFTGDYLTDGPMGLIPFIDPGSMTLTIGDFVEYTDSVYFVSQSGGGTGAIPTSPTTLSAAISAANALPAGSYAQVYVCEPLTDLFNMNIVNSVSIKSYTSAVMTLRASNMLSSMPFFSVQSDGTLEIEKITIDGSYVQPCMQSLVYMGSGPGASFMMGYASKIVGKPSFMTVSKGGGVYVGSGCTLYMNGGTIDSCGANEGGAIYVDVAGLAYLESATITNNVHFIAGNGAITVAGYVYANPVTFSGNTNDENTCILAGGVWEPL